MGASQVRCFYFDGEPYLHAADLAGWILDSSINLAPVDRCVAEAFGNLSRILLDNVDTASTGRRSPVELLAALRDQLAAELGTTPPERRRRWRWR